MNSSDIQHSALRKGILIDSDGFPSKRMFVRAIQEREGSQACFMTDKRYTCAEQDCEWRSDCKRLVADWLR